MEEAAWEDAFTAALWLEACPPAALDEEDLRLETEAALEVFPFSRREEGAKDALEDSIGALEFGKSLEWGTRLAVSVEEAEGAEKLSGLPPSAGASWMVQPEKAVSRINVTNK